MNNDMISKIKEADMVLVGIGEEFEDERTLRKQPNYTKMREQLIKEIPWALPVLNRYLLSTSDYNVSDALTKLCEILRNKNYFLIYLPTNDIIWDCGFDPKRVTTPCGGTLYRQCPDGCSGGLGLLSGEENAMLQESVTGGSCNNMNLGICPECGKPLILNNIYAGNYDENGYLEQWKRYTGWLQGTLNRNLLILELGVGMQHPTVVRWPFEKTTYFNRKSHMVRVHEHLFYLSEEIKDRACSVPYNSIDWLLDMES